MYILDTNIIIYWLKGNSYIGEKIDQIKYNNIGLTLITLSELYYGAYKSQRVEENIIRLETVKKAFQIYSLSYDSAKKFGELKNNLEKTGQILNDADLFIASICLINKSILVTNNLKHFQRIEDLKCDNWYK